MHWLLRAPTMDGICAVDAYTLNALRFQSGRSADLAGSMSTTPDIGHRSDGVFMSAATATFLSRLATNSRAERFELPVSVAILRAYSCSHLRPPDTDGVSRRHLRAEPSAKGSLLEAFCVRIRRKGSELPSPCSAAPRACS